MPRFEASACCRPERSAPWILDTAEFNTPRACSRRRAGGSFVRANQPVLKGRTVIVPSDKMSGYPDLVEDLLHQGTDVIAARPAGDSSDPVAYTSALVTVLDAALVTVGRPLTRTRFLEAARNVQVRSPGWPDLDFRRFPKNGTELVEFIRMTSRRLSIRRPN
jgi:hypothetical protein